MDIGKRIKELRIEKGETQETVAQKLQISRSALALYETDKRQVPNEVICLMVKYFDVTAGYLLGLED